ncbi:MAG: dTDP-4-dehydrorhamnose 3,5-epimerase [Verrucomicrobia bacterium]|nr:dTDP-4-dehydrorhamnose 3,5-epimerase [Verrucomicrobiota bacterium]
MKCVPTAIPEVLLLTPDVHGDERGFFMESFSHRRYAELGIKKPFVQDNYSHSRAPALRGMHYQLNSPQAKLITVIWGEIFDVAVDIRVGSPTFGGWIGQRLSDQNRNQLYIPEGFAHGFCVLSEKADVMYKCTDYYAPSDERGIRWSDPRIGIEWPIASPLLSAKDDLYPLLADMDAAELPIYRAPAAP